MVWCVLLFCTCVDPCKAAGCKLSCVDDPVIDMDLEGSGPCVLYCLYELGSCVCVQFAVVNLRTSYCRPLLFSFSLHLAHNTHILFTRIEHPCCALSPTLITSTSDQLSTEHRLPLLPRHSSSSSTSYQNNVANTWRLTITLRSDPP